jgi:hypothetical protein
LRKGYPHASEPRLRLATAGFFGVPPVAERNHMTLKEIAAKIDTYLKKFEKDPTINARKSAGRTTPYWQAGAFQSGRYVGIVYVRFQGSHHISKADAEKYLAWLDAGNVGKHVAVPKER